MENGAVENVSRIQCFDSLFLLVQVLQNEHFFVGHVHLEVSGGVQLEESGCGEFGEWVGAHNAVARPLDAQPFPRHLVLKRACH